MTYSNWPKAVWFLMFCAISVCGCSSWPDLNALAAEGEANNAPIVIFGTKWIPPYNDRVSKVGFINLQGKDITSIRIFVAQCGAKGAVHFAGHLLLKGPFSSRQAYIADASWSEDPDHYFPQSNLSGIRLITKIEIDDADGGEIEYKDQDVKRLLDKRMANFCPVFTGY